MNNKLPMKWTLIEYYDLSLAISQFGGSYKSLSLLFSLFFVPVLIWQFRRDTARIIMRDENISLQQATERLNEKFQVINVYKKLDQVDKI